jgi:hypothetical protein
MRKRKDLIFDSAPIRDEELAYGLHFDGSDLAANRAGYLSERQAFELLDRKKGYWIDTSIACVRGIILLCVGPLAFAFLEPSMLFPVFVLLFFAGYFAYLAWQKRKTNIQIENDFSQGAVAVSSGRVILDTRQRGKSGANIEYTLTIGNDTFKLDKQAFLRFKHLEHYTVYFAPLSRVILSAEPSEMV